MGIKKETEQRHRQEKYQFMREQVRPDRKRQLLDVCRKLGALAVTAVIFGGIAGGTFLAIKCQFEKSSAGAKPPATVTSAPTPAPTASAGAEPASDGRRRDLQEYSRLSEELAEVGERMEDSLVGVFNEENDAGLEYGMTERLQYGLVFEETERYFYIVTVCDAITERSAIQVRLRNNSVVQGRVLGRDDSLDLAVVSLKKDRLSEEARNGMRAVSLEGAADVVNGSRVVAVGCPGGVLRAVMTGAVSHEDIQVPVLDNELRVYSTDIPYSDKSSGVVLDMEGNVIGVITRVFPEYTGNTGMAFVDIASVRSAISLLRRGKQPPYMGIVAKTLGEDEAKSHGLQQGAYVEDVYSYSPAYRAGMRVADVIVQMNGGSIRSMEQIYQELLAHKKNDEMIFTVVRKSAGQAVRRKITVRLQ